MTDHHKQAVKDARDLHQYGYAQELFRDMGGFANFAMSFTVLSVVTGAITLFGHGLNYGGPAVNGIGWPFVTLMTLTVAVSMAEIASAIPTAGAMYHWAALLGGPAWGWFTAWFNFVGQIAITAGVDYGIAIFVVNLMGRQGKAAILLVYAALLFSHGILNHYGIRLVARLNDFSVWYHIAVTAVIVAAFWFFAPHQPVSFAFKSRFTTSNYPYWWAFLIGLLQAQWTYTGYDASAHITEETLDPRRNAPWGMIMAIVVSAVVGYLLLLPVTLAIKDLSVAAKADNPFIFIAQDALGAKFGDGLVWAILLAMWCCGLSAVTANARMIFAFARDKGLPYSKYLARVSPRFRTPAPAVWTSLILAFVVALYSDAYDVIVSISTIGLYVSYIIPVILVLRARRRGDWGPAVKENDHRNGAKRYPLGPWNLGKWGGLINVIAVIWTAIISVLFVCPPNTLTGKTFAGMTAVLIVYYLIQFKGKFHGPQKVGTEEELLRAESALEKTAAYR